ncbi:hypothetical protein C8R45DRAFT_1177805 [Mycena sanguinolenta]|nr:hypothetical protein C8R45DRAFT_1177805 [Mycena sanguinolenta]
MADSRLGFKNQSSSRPSHGLQPAATYPHPILPSIFFALTAQSRYPSIGSPACSPFPAATVSIGSPLRDRLHAMPCHGVVFLNSPCMREQRGAPTDLSRLCVVELGCTPNDVLLDVEDRARLEEVVRHLGAPKIPGFHCLRSFSDMCTNLSSPTSTPSRPPLSPCTYVLTPGVLVPATGSLCNRLALAVRDMHALSIRVASPAHRRPARQRRSPRGYASYSDPPRPALLPCIRVAQVLALHPDGFVITVWDSLARAIWNPVASSCTYDACAWRFGHRYASYPEPSRCHPSITRLAIAIVIVTASTASRAAPIPGDT